MSAHSSILARRIPQTEEAGRLHTVHGVAKEVGQKKQLGSHRNNYHHNWTHVKCSSLQKYILQTEHTLENGTIKKPQQ